LGQQVNLVKGVVMRTKAISAASTAASGLELAGEVLALRRQLDRLKSADTTTRKGVFELQQAMDKIQANNDAFTVDRFIMRLAVNCMPLPNPKHALITCGGLALRDFTHAWVNYSIPNALVEKKLEESAATISTRIRASAEQGRNDALAGRARDSGVIQQSEAYTVQQLGRKIGRVIRQLEDQSFIGKIISWFKYRNLLGAARKLQVDLSRGSNSEIMRQFQAAYEEAYDTTLLEKEIEEQAQAVREIQRRIVVLGDELEHLGLLIRRLQQEIERALEEPPEESSSDEDCDSSMPGQKLEQSLPDNLELAGNCGLLNRQPTINEFLMACQASEKQKTHTCTIVYCNHVFFHMGKQDVIECINDIRDQKRSAEEKERGWPNS